MLRRIKPEVWIAIASWLIAVVAVVVAIESNRQARIHNILSVRPVLKVIRVAQIDGAGIVLSNKGLGPAILKTIRYWADGRELTGRDGVIRRAGLAGIPDVKYGFGLNLVNAPVAVNEDIKLVWVPLPTDSNQARPGAITGAQAGLEEITWDYCYCSIYEECWHSEAGDLNVKTVPDCSWYRSAFRPVSN